MIKLLELRTEKGLSQREIAKVFNVSQGTYNNWENERTQPSIEQLIYIANFFDTSVDYLIGKTTDYKYSYNQVISHEQQKILNLFTRSSEKVQQAIITLLENTN